VGSISFVNIGPDFGPSDSPCSCLWSAFLLPAALGVGATKPMSGINFNSWTENATRLGMRIQETLAERTKDLSSLTSSGAGYYDTGEEKAKNIKAQLDSGSEREKLEAMKRLIAVSVSHTYSLRVTQSEGTR
jgi:hypothetical protein